MQRYTEIPSIDSELSVLYGRQDSLFPEEVLADVYNDASLSLDQIEVAGAEDEVEAIQGLKEDLISDIQDRIAELTNSATDASLGGLAMYRFASPDGSDIYLTRDGQNKTDHAPGYVKFSRVMIAGVATGDVPTLADFEAVPLENRADRYFALLRPIAGDGPALMTYHVDDQAYQYLLDRERLSTEEHLAKMKQQVDDTIQSKRTVMDFDASKAGVSKVIELDGILSQNLTPYEYSQIMRAGMHLVQRLVPPIE